MEDSSNCLEETGGKTTRRSAGALHTIRLLKETTSAGPTQKVVHRHEMDFTIQRGGGKDNRSGHKKPGYLKKTYRKRGFGHPRGKGERHQWSRTEATKAQPIIGTTNGK